MYGKDDPTEMQKLSAKMLKYEGWEILDITEREFKEWDQDKKVSNIKDWLKEAKGRQAKKGILDAIPKVYV